MIRFIKQIKIGNSILINFIEFIFHQIFYFNETPICKQGHEAGRIINKDDVWLGVHDTVIPNFTIGLSTVIGVGSVITLDIPPFPIAADVPAKVTRSRRNE